MLPERACGITDSIHFDAVAVRALAPEAAASSSLYLCIFITLLPHMCSPAGAAQAEEQMA